MKPKPTPSFLTQHSPGLPPQAWHEAVFTCIAGVWGEVVFPEKCNPNKNNLVAGKVCLRTKHMEYIQANMPVLIDGVHVCIRIRELLGECDDIYRSETPINSPNSETDQDSVNNPDEHGQSNEGCDDLDFLDGGSDDELFINKCQKEYFEGGGWIPTNSGEINYDSERTISDSHRRSPEFNLNIPVNSQCATLVTASNHKRKPQDTQSSCFIPETHFEERSQKAEADKVANVDLRDAASGMAPCERYVCFVPDSPFDSTINTSPEANYTYLKSPLHATTKQQRSFGGLILAQISGPTF
ncbi:hypothetical protein Tco_1425219 [Tanacetum coccineum]